MKKIFTIIPVILLSVLISRTLARSEEISYYDIPAEIRLIAWECQKEYDISQYLILAITYQESRCNADKVNGNVTQITNTDWYQEGIAASQSTDAKHNVRDNMRVCSFYINKWANEYPDNPYLWLRLWNEGDSAKSTQNATSYYSRKILERAERYEAEDEHLQEHCVSPELLEVRNEE